MLRVTVALFLFLVPAIHSPGQTPEPPDRSPPTESVADPRWRPEPGHQVLVPADNTPAARTFDAWDTYNAARAAHDVVGIDRQVSNGGLIKLARGTKILIIRDHAPVQIGRGKMSAEAFASSRLHARPAESADGHPVEVRIMDGPYADKLAFVSRKDIAKQIERRVVPLLNPGERATVARPGSMLAADYNDLYDLKFARIDGDGKAIAGLLRDGKMARLPEATKVVVIGTEGEFARVRVHAGSRLAGHSGYVPAGDLIPAAR